MCAKKPTPGQGRRVYQYSEEQMVYISDLLTLVEKEWAQKPVTPDTVESRQEILTRFGHVSHALEDFFFHSNFVEAAWAQTGQEVPFSADSGGGDDDDHEESGPRNQYREKRRYMRRMRAPAGKGDDLDKTTSNPMDQVYTGYFGAKDVFHTLIDGIKGIIHKELPSPADQMLAQVVGEHQEGLTDKQKEDKRKEQLAKHKQRLFNDDYITAARLAGEMGKLHEKSVASIERACQMDKNLWQKYPKIDMGISGFVKTLVDMAADEAEKSKKVWMALDSDRVTSDDRTDNGASNENIGSHSLMSKDSIRKHPLRQQAFNVASTIGVYVGKRMVEGRRRRLPVARSVNLPAAEADGGASNTAALQTIDWLHLVQHFVCHPDEAESWQDKPWWEWLMENPDPANTGHTLKFATEDEIAQRVKEEKKVELEKKYNDLAVDAEKEWHKAKAQAVGAFVGMAVGAVAGAIAGGLLGAAIGGPAGAVLGAIVGAVGGAIIGGLLGALVGGLF